MYDVLIIGSGAAGLALALALADDYQVALVSKDSLMAGSSPRAQGGIAAVMSQDDSYESHIDDTLRAGAGLCDPEAVAFTVKHAKEAIHWLVDHGVQFTGLEHQPEQFHLTQEGGHSHRRILHVADRTGVAMVKTLAEQVADHPHIHCMTQMTAMDLIMIDGVCTGAHLMDNATEQQLQVSAERTVLATGGASRCYRYTSNSNQTSGDGIAMAWRAGAAVADLEFNQFHPTTLYHPDADCFLISEAMRGEGALLKRPDGTRFMPDYDDRAELAPRDIVARAIDNELKTHGIDFVLLDISHKNADDIQRMFPTIYERCLSFGIDITKTAIPVVPAAHYTCGGVKTNLHAKTTLTHLYAIGEVACTGLHGANRMASNSLLECLVFAMSAGKDIRSHLSPSVTVPNMPALQSQTYSESPDINISELTETIRQIMWKHVGIVRSNARLQSALRDINQIYHTIESQYAHTHKTKDWIECRNLATVSKLIIDAAIAQPHSCGLHFNIDHQTQQRYHHETEHS